MSAFRTSYIIRLIFILFFTTGFFGRTASQSEDNSMADFLILIESSPNGLALTCDKGCAWEKLSFSLSTGNEQVVDQFGITTLDTYKTTEGSERPDFLFSIKKISTGIFLRGKKGTAWTRLSFSCYENTCYQYVDQSGMTLKE